MKKTKIFYWILTGLLAAFMTMSAIPDVLVTPETIAIFQHLGYPVYLLPFIGVAKLLGAVAILVPGFPRIKEWAYAGFTFDLAGAMYSSISVGDASSAWAFVLIPLAVLAGSYILYHKLRTARENVRAVQSGNAFIASAVPQ